MPFEFRLLGPVGLWVDGRRAGLGAAESAKPRCVLAVLLRTPGALVTTDALVERVWGDRPPGAAVRYKYVGWLRSALAPYGVALRHQDAGYVLAVETGQVDLHRFRQLAGRARRAADSGGAAEAARLLEEGLRLWHGPAVTGLPGTWAEMFRDQLGREHRDARVQWSRCALETGRHAEALRRLTEWETEYPVDEEVVALRMAALYRTGQQGEALACYERADRRLREALDGPPGPRLRAMHHRVRARDPGLDLPQPALSGTDLPGTGFPGVHLPGPPGRAARPAAVPAAPRPLLPRQLPAVTRHFTGRTAQLTSLDALADLPARPDGTVAVAAVVGGAGTGKTALALHWAHAAARRFPDGQLFVDLRGFAPGGRPVGTQEAIRGFLGALDVEPDRIPADPQARAALYRSLLAGRRMLVVLDDARGADQVRALLPGTSTCLVLVTSRDPLTGLVAAEGAQLLPLEPLTGDEARDLLTGRLGADRTAGEPAAVAELAALCARLPLALHLAAARAQARPARPLTDLAVELRDARRRLDVLRGGDPATDLRAVFARSYRTLSAGAARTFRLLGLHPGSDVTVPVATSLTGASRADADDALEELVEAHLLTEHSAGRFALHGLLRDHAAELSRGLDPDAERHAAVDRVLDHYLHTARAAARQLHPPRGPASVLPAPNALPATPAHPDSGALPDPDAHSAPDALPDPDALPAAPADPALDTLPDPGAPPGEPVGPVHASAWFAAEHAALPALVLRALERDPDPRPWQVHRTAAAPAVRHTAPAAARGPDAPGERARVHCGLGFALLRPDRIDDAEAHLRHAVDLSRALGDPAGRSSAHTGLAWLCGRTGRAEEALGHAREALRLYEQLGRLAERARALESVGRCHTLLGDHRSALARHEQSVAAYRELGDHDGLAGAWEGLGRTHHHLGQYARAGHCHRQALELHRENGDRRAEARTLAELLTLSGY